MSNAPRHVPDLYAAFQAGRGVGALHDVGQRYSG